MKYLILIFTLLVFSPMSFSQDGGTDQQLAQHYYDNQEFDKALIYYERLYDGNPSKFHFNRYLECLEKTGDLKTAERMLKKQVNRTRGDIEYQILLAKFYETHGPANKAESIYENLVDDLQPNARNIIKLYDAFKAQAKTDLAFATLQKGRKLLKKSYPLNYQFADYYGSIGETEKMMDEYLDMIDYHSSYKTDIQRVLMQQVDFSEDNEAYDYLKKSLIERSQKNPNDATTVEMLTWLFIQRQNFAAAYTHIKAYDKRTNAEGRLVFNLGSICVENKDYQTARKCFQYVVDLGDKSIYSVRGQNALLNVRFLQVTTLRNFTQEELNETINEYASALQRVGKSERSLPLMLEMAHIQAFYGNQAEEAIQLLNEALEIPGLTDMQKAETKMQLADIHVLHSDIWEAALLYSQIDKDFKYEAIGHEAKFKNARIFYYDGEFEYAQSQLDVLKQSTSKLIANDALKLSLLITDNLGLDSNYVAMGLFAQADLLIEQHQYETAFTLFDTIIKQFPAHSLGDEILLKKAYAMELRGEWNEAVAVLEELLKYHSDDILADDALFRLGDIYETRLLNNEKAAGYYRRILFDYKGSLYSAESRKRFQKLRGESSIKAEQEKVD